MRSRAAAELPATLRSDELLSATAKRIMALLRMGGVAARDRRRPACGHRRPSRDRRSGRAMTDFDRMSDERRRGRAATGSPPTRLSARRRGTGDERWPAHPLSRGPSSAASTRPGGWSRPIRSSRRCSARPGRRSGQELALPQVAAIAQLARKLGIPVARPAVAASADHDIELWVRRDAGRR